MPIEQLYTWELGDDKLILHDDAGNYYKITTDWDYPCSDDGGSTYIFKIEHAQSRAELEPQYEPKPIPQYHYIAVKCNKCQDYLHRYQGKSTVFVHCPTCNPVFQVTDDDVPVRATLVWRREHDDTARS